MNTIYQQLNSLFASEATLVVETITGYQQISGRWHIKPRTLSEHLIYYICQHHAEGIISGQHVELAPAQCYGCYLRHPIHFFLPRANIPRNFIISVSGYTLPSCPVLKINGLPANCTPDHR